MASANDLRLHTCVESRELNLALNKPTMQSSVRVGTAEIANDGVNNLELGAGEYTATDSSADQWWRVDLGSLFVITQILIFTPNDNGKNL